MHELDDSRERERIRILSPSHATREEEQRGPKELPSHEEEVLADFLDVVEVRDHDPPDLVTDAIERPSNRILDRGEREPTLDRARHIDL